MTSQIGKPMFEQIRNTESPPMVRIPGPWVPVVCTTPCGVAGRGVVCCNVVAESKRHGRLRTPLLLGAPPRPAGPCENLLVAARLLSVAGVGALAFGARVVRTTPPARLGDRGPSCLCIPPTMRKKARFFPSCHKNLQIGCVFGGNDWFGFQSDCFHFCPHEATGISPL